SGSSGSAAQAGGRRAGGTASRGRGLSRAASSRRPPPGEPGGLDQLAQRPLDLPLPALAGEPGCLRAGHDHEVVLGGQLGREAPERLAEQPLHAVSLDCSPDLATDRYAEPRVALPVRPRKRVEHEVARGVRPALAVDATDVGAVCAALPRSSASHYA